MFRKKEVLLICIITVFLSLSSYAQVETIQAESLRPEIEVEFNEPVRVTNYILYELSKGASQGRVSSEITDHSADNVTYYFTPLQNLKERTAYVFSIVGTDLAGNPGQVKEFTFMIDLGPTTVELLKPQEEGWIPTMYFDILIGVNRDATCRGTTTANTDYGSMTTTLIKQSDGLTHKAYYSWFRESPIYISCLDSNGDYTEVEYGFRVDSTAPYMTLVDDNSGLTEYPEYTNNPNAVRVMLAAEDPESDIALYNYSLQNTMGELVTNWLTTTRTNEWLLVTKDKDGNDLELTNLARYYFYAQAINGAGSVSPLLRSNGIMVDTSIRTIEEICSDGVLSDGEAYADCGGICPGCDLGHECVENIHCASGYCENNVCTEPTCDDNVANGDESDVDCGGSCSQKCSLGASCNQHADCASARCVYDECVEGYDPTDTDGDGMPDEWENEYNLDINRDDSQEDPDSDDYTNYVEYDQGTNPRVSDKCNDGVKNGDESDVDCGGSCPDKCETGLKCFTNDDCVSGSCSSYFYMCLAVYTPTCDDGVVNGDESDTDCGGSCPDKCGSGKVCYEDSDCISNDCTYYGICFGDTSPDEPDEPDEPDTPTASCSDGIKNGDESDVDCGGSCAAKCGVGENCNSDADCTSNRCSFFLRNCLAPLASECDDNTKNGDETDVDCGGGTCPACDIGKACLDNSDCVSQNCDGGLCAAGTAETGTACEDVSGYCTMESECNTNFIFDENYGCVSGKCCIPYTAPSECTDGIKNGDETDVDCGGSCPDKCDVGEGCKDDDDCTSDRCAIYNLCLQPTTPPDEPDEPSTPAADCYDGVKNGDESDVDCGGSCTGCEVGQFCYSEYDCISGRCAYYNLCLTSLNDADNDNDGMPDEWEQENSLDDTYDDSQEDPDSDTYTNIEEYENGQDPQVPDSPPGCYDGIENGDETDVDCGGSCPEKCLIGEGCYDNSDCNSDRCAYYNLCLMDLTDSEPDDMPDNWEEENDLDPTTDDSEEDPDNDGSTNEEEYEQGTDPQVPDPQPTCTDGIWNGDETDVDCGGPDCAGCEVGQTCWDSTDCLSLRCAYYHLCLTGMTDDSEPDGMPDDWEEENDLDPTTDDSEEDPDNDGSTNEEEYEQGTDPQVPEPQPTCYDGIWNGDETDVDCGGPDCGGCDVGDACFDSTDCISLRCAYYHLCLASLTPPPDSGDDSEPDGMPDDWEEENDLDPTVDDSEEDPDNDGSTNEEEYEQGTDPQVPESQPSCYDNIWNGDETDIDCGGSCLGCDLGEGCYYNSDCLSNRCSYYHACLVDNTPRCDDNIWNGDESDTDCGGSCSGCALGEYCYSNTDCASGTCSFAGTCIQTYDSNDDSEPDGMPDDWEEENDLDPTVDDSGEDPDNDGSTNVEEYEQGTDPQVPDTPTCTDNIMNGAESDVDCGGTCPTKCDVGEVCVDNSDCESNRCAYYHMCLMPYDNPDTEPDGMPDAWEEENDLDPTTDDSNEDPDNDGVSNEDEYQQGSDPQVPEPDPTCYDGIWNGDETDVDCGGPCSGCDTGQGCWVSSDCISLRCAYYRQCLAPIEPPTDNDNDDVPDEWEDDNDLDDTDTTDADDDSDGDGTTNEEEYEQGTDPQVPDPEPTCFDGILNQDEADVDCGGSCLAKCAVGEMCYAHTDCISDRCAYYHLCLVAYDSNDNDADGMPDDWEGNNELDTGTDDSQEDPDDDGSTNIEEYEQGTDPQVPEIPSCFDHIENGDESDIDCGGTCDVKCSVGEVCRDNTDCESDRCSYYHLCLAPYPPPDDDNDGLPDNWEEDNGLDDGTDDSNQDSDGDGQTNEEEYEQGTDPQVPDAPTCTDGIENGDETDVDCGGPDCSACDTGEGCFVSSDCVSLRCAYYHLCLAPIVPSTDNDNDGIPDDWEEDNGLNDNVDDSTQDSDGDGISNEDEYEQGTDPTEPDPLPSCWDGILNGGETDIDCGGSCSAQCAVGQACWDSTDCESGRCAYYHLCLAPYPPPDDETDDMPDEWEEDNDLDPNSDDSNQDSDGDGFTNEEEFDQGTDPEQPDPQPTCTDNIWNGLETDIDCGGTVCYGCAVGEGCYVADDCSSGRCSYYHVCLTDYQPSCDDGIWNGDEADLDCGGSCDTKCSMGSHCQVDSDCVTNRCSYYNLCLQAYEPETDNDNDDMVDEWEDDNGLNDNVDDSQEDPDNDGLDNEDEYEYGTDPQVPDAPSCDDGILNGDESDIDCGGSNCNLCGLGEMCVDDSDCQSNRCAYYHMCLLGYDVVDNDNDNMPDDWEGENDLDTGTDDSQEDPDNDGSTNIEEYEQGTDPQVPDAASCTDGVENGDESDIDCGGSECPGCDVGKVCRDNSDCTSDRCSYYHLCLQSYTTEVDSEPDGMPDDWEEENDLDPNTDDSNEDADGDGASNEEEYQQGTDPQVPDPAPTCYDGKENGDETGVDCGGPACSACDTGEGCWVSSDCVSLRCAYYHMCLAPIEPPTDDDNDDVPDAWEDDNDLDDTDTSDADQDSDGDGTTNEEEYQQGTDPQVPDPEPTCTDGIENGDETDVDCGGSCPACLAGRVCIDNSDCISERCAYYHLCLAPYSPDDTDSDGMPDDWEDDNNLDDTTNDAAEDADNDGTTNIEEYEQGSDPQVPDAPTCTDGIENGDESDVDCGGVDCPSCSLGKVCRDNNDCESDRCSYYHLCLQAYAVQDDDNDGMPDDWEDDNSLDTTVDDSQEDPDSDGITNEEEYQQGSDPQVADSPTCSDGMENQDETDIDCGGLVCESCDVGKTCFVNEDCISNRCSYYHACLWGYDSTDDDDDGMPDQWEDLNELDTTVDDSAEDPDADGFTNVEEYDIGSDPQEYDAPSCTDGKNNGDETDVDCGGPCPDGCVVGKTCQVNADCESNRCSYYHTCLIKYDPSDDDDDGMPDQWEQEYELNITINDANEDADDDGYTNIIEYEDGTDPQDSEDHAIEQASCSDGIMNGGETDVDCGGICSQCTLGQGCQTGDDCDTGRCSYYHRCLVAYEQTDGDNDGMPDDWEEDYDLDTSRDDSQEDPDDDGIVNIQEYQDGTNPQDPDDSVHASCTDRVWNGDETDVDCGGSCSAKCGLGLGCLVDSDCESGRCSFYECMIKYNETDNDNDDMPDEWETENELDTTKDDSEDDNDGDGDVNEDEYEHGTDPQDEDENIETKMATNDEDGDGMPDQWEKTYGLSTTKNDAAEDPDVDELVNINEYRETTNPRQPDTDEDKYSDGIEVQKGTNPLDPKDHPGNPWVWIIILVLVVGALGGGGYYVYENQDVVIPYVNDLLSKIKIGGKTFQIPYSGPGMKTGGKATSTPSLSAKPSLGAGKAKTLTTKPSPSVEQQLSAIGLGKRPVIKKKKPALSGIGKPSTSHSIMKEFRSTEGKRKREDVFSAFDTGKEKISKSKSSTSSSKTSETKKDVTKDDIKSLFGDFDIKEEKPTLKKTTAKKPTTKSSKPKSSQKSK